MTKLSRLAVNEEGFAFDPVTGDSFVLNETGLVILKGLANSKTVGEIAEELSQSHEVEALDAEHDVADLVERLRDFGLL